MIGSDGWFHFYQDPNSSQVVKLAIDCMACVRRIASTSSFFKERQIKVVMGINETKNVQLVSGGPLDDDSIIAHYLLRKEYKQYDIRSTEEAVSHLIVPPQQQNEWSPYHSLIYDDGRTIRVYGHT